MRARATRKGRPIWGTSSEAAREGSAHQRHHHSSTSPPRDWDEWSRYEAAVVGRYRRHVREWEVWNEPWSGTFWSGTTADYLKLLSVTRRAVKSAERVQLLKVTGRQARGFAEVA